MPLPYCHAEDEEVLDACSAIIAACSGPMATAGKVSIFTYDDAAVHIREGALGDGLGAKVWLVAHMLCLELASNRGLVAGRRVLELGSGCGVCGLAAAALGAGHVVLSDVEGPVLRNLRSCMHLNANARAGAAAAAAAAAGGGCNDAAMDCDGTGRAAAATEPLPSDADLFDEAEEVEGFDELMADMVGGGGDGRATHGSAAGPSGWQQQQQRVGGNEEQAWEVGNTSVRLLDWAESRVLLDSGVDLGELGPHSVVSLAAAAVDSGTGGGAALAADGDMPPGVPVWERFPVIIGSEVMYERVHAELVAAVVKHRLAPGGCAVLQCAVRELKVFEHFARECRRRGLRYRNRQIDPASVFGPGRGAAGESPSSCFQFEGILGRADEYEGGVLLMAIDHEDSPCQHWYRDDWETVGAA